MNELYISEDLIRIIREANNVVVLTGAGVSKESGIPTFRDAQTGLWAKYDPMELATPKAFQENPQLVWRWYQWRRRLVSDGEPNLGHYALVEMENRVPEFLLITQNIDGFHDLAGTRNIIELHGNIHRNKCFDEGEVVENVEWESEEVPHCPNCNALIRPDVVWFGENLQPGVIDAALYAIQSAEVFFSIGTSTQVQPAASMPYYALSTGATVIEINPHDTPITQKVHYSLKGPSGIVLPGLVERVWNP